MQPQSQSKNRHLELCIPNHLRQCARTVVTLHATLHPILSSQSPPPSPTSSPLSSSYHPSLLQFILQRRQRCFKQQPPSLHRFIHKLSAFNNARLNLHVREITRQGRELPCTVVSSRRHRRMSFDLPALKNGGGKKGEKKIGGITIKDSFVSVKAGVTARNVQFYGVMILFSPIV